VERRWSPQLLAAGPEQQFGAGHEPNRQMAARDSFDAGIPLSVIRML
jgi:hypothetical protein